MFCIVVHGLEMAAQSLSGGTREMGETLFEACKNGNLERVASLLTPESVNSRDVAGRKSTPIHFAAGTVDKNKSSCPRSAS